MARSKSDKDIYNSNQQYKNQFLAKELIIGRINTNHHKQSKNEVKLLDQCQILSNTRRTTLCGDEYQLIPLKKTKSNVQLTHQDFSLQDPHIESNFKSKAQESTEIHSSANYMQSVSKYKQKQQFPFLSSILIQKQKEKDKIDYSGSLYFRIQNLQRHIKQIQKQRENQKNKLLQYFLILDKLKFENQCLKIAFKNKYNNKNYVQQHVECIEKQKQDIFQQFSQVLAKHQQDKINWNQDKLNMKNQISSILHNTNQLKKQKVLMKQKMNELLQDNKKLEKDFKILQQELKQRNIYIQEMDQKVHSLKQALEHFKQNGDQRMKKMEQNIDPQSNYIKQQLQHLLSQSQAKILYAQCSYRECQKQLKNSYSFIQELKEKLYKCQNMKLQFVKNKQIQDQLNAKLSQKCEQIQKIKYQIKQIEIKVIKIMNQQIQQTKQKQKIFEQNKIYKKQIQKYKQIIYQLKNQIQINLIKYNQSNKCFLQEKQTLNDKLTQFTHFKSENQKYYQQIQQMQQQIYQLQQQIRIKQSQLSNTLSLNEPKSSHSINSAPASSLSIPPSLSSYSKLQIKLCSILNIYLTSNIDKIVSPIQKMLENVKKWQSNSDCYEQLLNVFELKENPGRLLFDMKICKNNYLRIIDINRILQSQLAKVKYDATFFAQSNEQAIQQIRRLEPIVQDYNTKIIKLSFRNLNSKFNLNGSRRL